MLRKLAGFPLAVVATVSVASFVCQAKLQTLLTSHGRGAVRTGQAPFVGPVPGSQVMRLVFVLPLRHQPELKNFLQELYDAFNPAYRQFLTVEDFTARFGPSQEDYDAVIQFAKANGLAVVSTSRNRINIDVIAPVANIEKALHITMSVYQRPDRKPHLLRSRPGAHRGVAVRSLAHRGAGQLFDPTSPLSPCC